MKDRLRVTGFVVVLVAVWAVGFLWARGDLPGTGDKTRATHAEATTPSPSATPPTRTMLVPSKVSPSKAARSSRPAKPAKPPKRTAEQPLGVTPSGRRPAPQPLPPVFEFRVATFNVLGSNHTQPGGNRASYASGSARVNGILSLLAQHHVSVAGLQEFQVPQRRAFASRAPGWSMYPSLPGRAPNTVVWRNDVWERVEGRRIAIPYFFGRPQPMPYVLLRHRASGVVVYVSTFHNPASTNGPAQRYRNEATRREIALFRRLDAAGIPQLVTGDMNEKAEYFCRVTAATTLRAAQGGANDGRCQPPAEIGIDWIFGSSHVEFSDFGVDRSGLVRRTSDHPFVSVTARVDAVDYDKAYRPPG